MKKYVQTEVFLTRACDLKCSFCKVYKQRRGNLDTENWMRIFDDLKQLSNFVVLFGGEPTLREDLGKLIDYANSIDLPYTLISNSTHLERLKGYDLKSFTASVDNLGNDYRSKCGIKALLELKKKGVKDLTANILISKSNLTKVAGLVEYFNRKDITSIIVTVHAGNEPFWMYRGPRDNTTFTQGDKEILSSVLEELIEMKKEGYKILDPVKYFEALKKYAIDLNWHCSLPVTPVIDEDGSVMPCVDYPAKYRLKVEDLFDYEKYKKYFEEQTKSCPGCGPYDHQFIPELAFRKGVPDLVLTGQKEAT